MKYIGNYKELIPENCEKFDISTLHLPEKRLVSFLNTLKLEPGYIDYTHTDKFLCDFIEPVKYLMFLNDWTIGHILTYNDKMISNYKAGDLYQIDNDQSIAYCLANIGYNTLNILEINLHNGSQI